MVDFDIESAAFLESVLNASSDCIKVLSLQGKLLFMNNGGLNVMEVDDFNTAQGCDWTSFWAGENHPLALGALEAAKAGQTGKFTGMANTLRGNPRWWDVTVTPIFGQGGASPSHLLSISRDITEAKEAQTRRELLTEELDHRVRNLLAVVSAIAAQTFAALDRSSLAAFTARLVALGNAQGLLVQTAWQSASIHDVVDKALKPHAPEERAHCSGPEVPLSAKEALALALAVHELATNATKYGAWSNSCGKVEVRWTVTDRELRFFWNESGGPEVQAPTRTGFGSRILDRNLASEFRGKVEADYCHSGLRFTLIAPR
ncbi:sensor histidine kinase [Allopontixanthobacter sediminis]|uniref:histidine kinase n=1 Tax=Allopontixanthobacter sediminis TaxID=1689985 RepID=A0A845B7D9_9SPHN|nr:PAS domain-containing sensor histidine kinase [Allopontixanthobacter sediminis]MXP45382.1 PAS domain-containing protein [Allopontixanthobacter sediminis]